MALVAMAVPVAEANLVDSMATTTMDAVEETGFPDPEAFAIPSISIHAEVDATETIVEEGPTEVVLGITAAEADLEGVQETIAAEAMVETIAVAQLAVVPGLSWAALALHSLNVVKLS